MPLYLTKLLGYFISQCSQLGTVIDDPSSTAAYIEPYGTVKLASREEAFQSV